MEVYEDWIVIANGVEEVIPGIIFATSGRSSFDARFTISTHFQAKNMHLL